MINGGSRLNGAVKISGAKNAAVAILPAVLLSDAPCVIDNIPKISDVDAVLKILYEIGAEIRWLTPHKVYIDPIAISKPVVSHQIAKNMRATCYFMGALIGRFGKASVTLPGGCDFASRPIDQHLKGFEALGCTKSIEYGMVNVESTELTGTDIYFDVVTVGATINVMLAACKAKGTTIMENAAKEPHVVDLANFLNSMGAEIMGAGTDVIKIKGVESLTGCEYAVIPDQIEAGTYMAAAVATGGDVEIENVIPKHLESIISKLKNVGAEVEEFDESVRITTEGQLHSTVLKTLPHPGFPTDMQPQLTVLLALADGLSTVTEGVWDNRFRYVDELARMGANISVDGKVAVVQGVPELTGAPVKAVDLRAGAAMIIAGLAAKGTTVIEDISHIERGYEGIVDKLRALGGDIKIVEFEDDDEMEAESRDIA